MENKEIKLDAQVDTDSADISTTEGIELDLEDSILSNFTDLETENDLAENEKLKELNKKLPSWSLVPPKKFIK